MGCLFIQQTMKMSLGLDQNGAVIVWQLVEVMHCFWGLAMKHSGLELGVNYPPPLVNPPEWSRHLPRDNNKDTHTQRGINFYFKPEGPAAPAGKQQKKRKPLRGGRVQ